MCTFTFFIIVLARIASVAVGDPGMHRLRVNQVQTPQSKLLSEKYANQFTLTGDHHQPIHGYPNMQYYVEVSLGTPPQFFKLVIDTASSSILVPDVSCSSDSCKGRATYNSSLSSTYKPNGTDIGGGVAFRGFVSQDVMRIGGMLVEKQDFVEVTYSYLNIGLFDGYLGLAYPSLAPLGLVPPFYNMLRQDYLAQPIFTLRLPSPSREGQVVFGGIDPTDYTGSISYVPVRRKIFWEVELHSIRLGNHMLDLVDTTAVIDSGTPFIAMPTDVASILNLYIGAEESVGGLYTVNCKDVPGLPDLTFRFGDVLLVLKGAEYVVYDKDNCVTAFVGVDIVDPESGVMWIMGNVLLRKWFSVYDVERGMIGFAEAI